ncbi:unnamed protein product [Oikopleura dioica]|uniref:F-box domain-containing protein n=1 Tax=Oikopleura dioica TaxID=34765 RepID=E4YGN6_OIKDI|nr:unnamed protein product [Oikopleura dioica]
MLDKLPVDCQLKIAAFLPAEDLYTVASTVPQWRVTMQHANTVRTSITNDLKNRKTISSTLLKFLDRKDVNLHEFLEVANQKPAPLNLLTRTYNRFLLAFVKRPKKIVIFGNGLENGLVTFLMTQCTEIGLKLAPVMFTRETRGGFIVEFNDCLFDLNALYPATREERLRNNEISLVNDNHELVPQAARRCRDSSAAICIFSARKEPNQKAFPELKAICEKIPQGAKIIIVTGLLNN